MTIHLLKMAVGIDDIEQLRSVQARRLAAQRRGKTAPRLRHFTRHRPRRADEILDGGSMYWIIRNRKSTRINRYTLFGVETTCTWCLL